MKRFITLLYLLSGFCFSVIAQKKTKLPCIDKEFSVVAHVVKDSLGVANIDAAQIYNLVNSVNPIFDSICVSFKVCDIKYIDNFMYDTLSRWDEMKNQFHVDNRINIYFVSKISVPAGAAGFAGLGAICNTDDDGIVLVKTASTIVLAHEFGHYFGLSHTFESSMNPDVNRRELADGSNSITESDQITDTPADPYDPSFKDFMYTMFLSPDPKTPCKFIGKMQDAKGFFYDPLVGNTMSYYPEECNCGFTHEQYLKMAKTFLSNPKMW
jgi:hypothetical protein